MIQRLNTYLPRVVVFALAVNILCIAESQLPTRHVRDAVVNGQAQLIGKLPANKNLRFDMVLPLRDRAGLQNFLQELQDPFSPSYHQFLTPQEFTARFGPSQEDWDALVAYAKANGFTLGAFTAAAVRRYAAEATDEEWLTLMSALGRAQDPGMVCMRRALEHVSAGSQSGQ